MRYRSFITIGIITGIVMVAIGFIAFKTGHFFKTWLSYSVYIPMLAGILVNGVLFSKANDGYVRFEDVLKNCMKMTMIIVAVIVVWHLVSIAAFPEKKEMVMQRERAKLEMRNNMDPDKIDASMRIVSMVYYPVLIFSDAFSKAFFGLIFSLLAGAAAQKKGPRPMEPTINTP